MKYVVYCDGSTKGNGSENSVGAWAYVVVNEQYNSMSFADVQAVPNTTNQRMELCAAIEALTKVCSICDFPEDSVVVYTDSAYLHNCYQQKWYENWQKNGWKNAKKQPVANQDLWEMLIPYFETFGVDFIKVKGHAGNMWNEYVDDLAQTAAARLQEKMNNESSSN
jgi:ribonuclease HI